MNFIQDITIGLQFATCISLIAMYYLIGYHPRSKWGEKLFWNITSAIAGTALNIIAGYYYLIFMQIFAVAMGYKQWKANQHMDDTV